MRTVGFPSPWRLAAPCFAFALTASAVANGAWPMARHDASRTGASSGSSNMVSPTPYWRTYLGGSAGAGQLLTTDADGDGTPDIILVSGGRVTARRANDSVIWNSDLRGIQSFAGIGDLNGDGVSDIVAVNGNQVVVFAATTGAVEWTEPAGEMGTLGVARVGDVTGDGKADVVVSECGCCGVYSGNTGFIWSFGNGFPGASRLGSLPVFSCGSFNSVTLVQADDTSKDEILVADYSHFALTDASGTVLAATGSVGTWTSVSKCIGVDLDGSPGQEIVCFVNSSDSPSTSQRRITVLHYAYGDGQAPSLDVLWNQVVAPDVGGDMRWVDPVVDLDGDGKFEVVVSTLDPNAGWQTRIFDALTGAEFTPAIGGAQVVAGTAALEQATQRILLTTSATAGGLTGWKFGRNPQPGVTQRWQLANVKPVSYERPDLLALGSVNLALLATPLQGNGLDDVIVQQQTGSAALAAYSAAGGMASLVATSNLAADTTLQYAWIVPPITTTVAQVALARTDGVLNLLDTSIAPSHLSGASGPEVDVRLGGYYATGGWRETSNAPRVFSLDGNTPQAVLVTNSRQALQRFDAASSSWASPPTPAWTLPNTYAPTIVPNLDGTKPAAACLAQQATTPPTYSVRLVLGDGSIKWDVPLETAPLADLVPGSFDATGSPDLVVQWGSPSSTNLETKAIGGADGHTIWETQPFNAGGLQSPGISVAKYDADAYDDIYFEGLATRVLSGLDGSQLVASASSTASYALPVLTDTNGDGSNEVLLTAYGGAVTLFSHDLSTALWTSSDVDGPYPYGAVAQCAGASPTPVLVEGSWQHPARLKVTPLNGSTLGMFTTFVLASGQLYGTEADATASSAFLGQLTSANVHANLTGQNHPTAVVGSTDGWLYGVNPCTGTLDFAVQIGSAVGEAVFGDTDGDGKDEILVTAADGYLYDFKNNAVAQPSYVWDVDPPAGITDHDIDTIVTTDTLWGTWAAVPGATGYSVAVTTAAGKIISNPAWQDAGTTTQASVAGLPLSVGDRYIFAVRALSSAGPSVDAVSNGVTVTAIGGEPADAGPPPEAGSESGMDATTDAQVGEAGSDAPLDAREPVVGGSGGGCGCRAATTESKSTEGWCLFGAAIALLGGRRRRSRSTTGSTR